MTSDLEEIGQILAGHRKEHGYTLEQLSVETGIGVSTLSEIERGLKWPRITTVKRLAAVYGVRFIVESVPAHHPTNFSEFIHTTQIDAASVILLEKLGRLSKRTVYTVAEWQQLYTDLHVLLGD